MFKSDKETRIVSLQAKATKRRQENVKVESGHNNYFSQLHCALTSVFSLNLLIKCIDIVTRSFQ